MTYYFILGVSETASAEEIRAAYIAKMKYEHPDATIDQPARPPSSARELNEAYAVLRDERRRTQYDIDLATDRAIRSRRLLAGVHSAARPLIKESSRGPFYVVAVVSLLAGITGSFSETTPYSRPSWFAQEENIVAAVELPSIRRKILSDSALDVRLVMQTEGVGYLQRFSEGCFAELRAVPSLSTADKCVSFDLAARNAAGQVRLPAFFDAAVMQRRHLDAFRQLGLPVGLAQKRVLEHEELLLDPPTL